VTSVQQKAKVWQVQQDSRPVTIPSVDTVVSFMKLLQVHKKNQDIAASIACHTQLMSLLVGVLFGKQVWGLQL